MPCPVVLLGVVEESHRVADAYLFYALDVKACFPGNGEELREAVLQYEQHISPKAVGWYRLLTPSGLNFVSDPAILHSFGDMTDHDILQIAICKTEPFQAGSNQVLDMRNGFQRHYPCRDRRQLIEALADALLDFDRTLRGIAKAPKALRDNTLHSIGHIGILIQHFIEHRKMVHIPAHSPLRYKRNRDILKEVMGSIFDIFGMFTLADWARIGQRFQRTAFDECLANMHKAFKDYGPQKAYVDKAIYKSLSVILVRLAVDQTLDLAATPSALERRLQRYRHSLATSLGE